MFLPLDDVLEEGKHIDLQVHPNTATIANSSNNNSNSLAGGSRRSRSGRRSSIAPGNSAVSFGENAYGYHSTKDWGGGEACMPGATGGGGGGGNEINRPAMFLTEQDYGNSFKMSTCTVDQVGYSACVGWAVYQRLGWVRFRYNSRCDVDVWDRGREIFLL